MTSKTHEAIERGDDPGRERQARSAEPAPRLEDLLKKPKQELVELAAELKLKGVSKLPKPELARRVLAARLEAQAARAPEPAQPAARSPERPRPTTEPRPKAQAAPEVRPAAPPPAPPAPDVRPAAPPPAPPAPDVRPAAPPRPASQPAAPAAVEEPGSPSGGATVAGAVPSEKPSPAAAARLDLGPGGAAEPRQDHIPWSYGQDRVTAMAVDPETLYVYWEVTDPALERARAALGGEGGGAWLGLRVYDITGLIFDGTNAHSYFDHGLGRFDRQWFFTVGKPSSSAIVEIGMRAPSGAFARVARSSRVDFPRSSAAPWSDPEWMTVLASGERGAGRPGRAGQAGRRRRSRAAWRSGRRPRAVRARADVGAARAGGGRAALPRALRRRVRADRVAGGARRGLVRAAGPARVAGRPHGVELGGRPLHLPGPGRATQPGHLGRRGHRLHRQRRHAGRVRTVAGGHSRPGRPRRGRGAGDAGRSTGRGPPGRARAGPVAGDARAGAPGGASEQSAASELALAGGQRAAARRRQRAVAASARASCGSAARASACTPAPASGGCAAPASGCTRAPASG